MSARIFVGNLPIDIKERELEDLFSKYGKIRDIDIKSPGKRYITKHKYFSTPFSLSYNNVFIKK